MIRVNGVALDNLTHGWVLARGSQPYSAFEADLAQVQVAGRDGSVPTSTTRRAPLWPLVVNTSPEGWEKLQALFGSPTLVLTRDDRTDVEASVRFVASSIERVYPRNQWIDVKIILEVTSAYWRSKTEKTASVPLSAASVTLDVFPGMSAPIPDAMIRLKGAATGVQVTDASGAWLTLPSASAAQYVRFESATGRCFITTTDTWTGGTDVSGQVDFGGPRDNFEITHLLDPALLSTKGRLTITSGTRSGAVVDVRGKSAHAL